MLYSGFYINLDRSVDRRAAMEAQFARLGLSERYARFPANEGGCGYPASTLTANELGCFASHYEVLRQNLGSERHLHVLEDDAVLAGCAADVVTSVVSGGMLDNHDLIFTDTIIPLDTEIYRDLRARFARDVVTESGQRTTKIRFGLIPYTACMASYVVNRESIGKLVDLLGAELSAGARLPIDLLIRNAVGRGTLRAKCLFPFVTSVVPDKFASTLGRKARNWHSDFAMELIRHGFYVDCDRSAALALAERHLSLGDEDFHGRLLGRVLTFTVTSGFVRP